MRPLIEETSPNFAAEFSSLLGAPLVTTDVLTPATDRDSYFRSCSGYEHLLFDPNTGLKLRMNQSERSVDHLFDTDLFAAADSRPTGLTMVFDQSLSRGRTVEPP